MLGVVHLCSLPPSLSVAELQPSEQSVQSERKKRALEELASQLSHKYSLLRADRDGGKKVHVLVVCQAVGVSGGGCVRWWVWWVVGVSGGGCVRWWVC